MGDRASSLSIASTSLSNAGNYTCVAQNAAGIDYHSTYLEVNGITDHKHDPSIYYIVVFFRIRRGVLQSGC